MQTHNGNGSNGEAQCRQGDLERNNFFRGMLLTEEDFQNEQHYFLERFKRLNRNMWGSGVVCGLELKPAEAGMTLKIMPGMALDCQGNVIELTGCETVDLSHLCCKPPADECDNGEAQGDTVTVYIGIKYKETPFKRVPVYDPAADCDNRACEYSRLNDGYCVVIKDSCDQKDCCADVLVKRQGQTDVQAFCESTVKCAPSCTCSDCVVMLGKVEVQCQKEVVTVDHNACRAYVWSAQLMRHLFCWFFGDAREAVAGDGCADGQEAGPDFACLMYQNPIAGMCSVFEQAGLLNFSTVLPNMVHSFGTNMQDFNADIVKRFETIEKAQVTEKELLSERLEEIKGMFVEGRDSDASIAERLTVVGRERDKLESAINKKIEKVEAQFGKLEARLEELGGPTKTAQRATKSRRKKKPADSNDE